VRRYAIVDRLVPMHRTTQILLVLTASFAVNGIVEPFVSPRNSTALAFAHAVVIGVLCYAWTRADALQRKTIPPRGSAIFAGLLPLLGVPLYLFRTRGGKGGIKGTTKALILLILLVVGSGLLSEFVLLVSGKQ